MAWWPGGLVAWWIGVSRFGRAGLVGSVGLVGPVGPVGLIGLVGPVGLVGLVGRGWGGRPRVAQHECQW